MPNKYSLAKQLKLKIRVKAMARGELFVSVNWTEESERIRISVGEAFKKLSLSNPISHQSVFKLNSKFIHCAAPIKGFSLGFVHHIS
jgi:hypothetical protein